MFKKVDNTPDGYTKMTKRETKALVRHLVKVKRIPKYRFVTCNGYCKTTPIGNTNQFIIDTELCFLVKVIFFLTGLFIMPYAILIDGYRLAIKSFLDVLFTQSRGTFTRNGYKVRVVDYNNAQILIHNKNS